MLWVYYKAVKFVLRGGGEAFKLQFAGHLGRGLVARGKLNVLNAS